jgi:uncharacterized protein (UPF0147 family)
MAKRITKAAEETFLALYAVGATVENAAFKAGMGVRTAYRRLGEPAFQARLTQARFDTEVRTTAMLTGAGLGAVKTFVDLQQDSTVPASVRRAAARDVLEYGLKYRESTGTLLRIAAIEQQLANARVEVLTRTSPE